MSREEREIKIERIIENLKKLLNQDLEESSRSASNDI